MAVRLVARFILSGSLLFLPPSLAAAQPSPTRVTVRVTDSQGQGVRSTVHVDQSGTVRSYPTASNGVAIIDLGSCAGSTAFTVIPFPFYLSGERRQVDCGHTEVPFRLRQHRYAAAVLPAYTEVRTAASASPQFASAADSLAELLASGSPPEIAVAANELAASLRRAGNTPLANAYSLLAIQAGIQAIDPDASVEGMERYLTYDAGQARVVTTREGIDLLAGFQQRANLPTTRQWDYRTFQALR